MESSHRRLVILALFLGSGLGLWALGLWALGPEPDAGLEGVASMDGTARAQRSRIPDDALSGVESAEALAQGPGERESISLRREVFWSVVEILVTDAQGPVADAIVKLDSAFQAHEPSRRGAAPSEGAEAEFVTGEDGTVVLELRADLQRKIHVTHEGLSWAQQRTWRSARAGSRATLKIRLLLAKEESELLVRSSPSGAPIAGALVSAGSVNTMTVPIEGAHAVSNDRGLVRLPVARKGGRDHYRISVAAEGHSKRTLQEDRATPDATPTAPRTIWLKKHASIRGTAAVHVTESDPSRIQSAEVLLMPSSSLRQRIAKREPYQTVPDWVDARGTVTDGIDFAGDALVDSQKVKRDGSWALENVKFPGELEERSDLVLLLKAHGVTRILAENLSLHPGDVLLLDDPWLSEPALHLNFTLDDGRPASDLGKVVLTSVSPTDSSIPGRSEATDVMVAAGDVSEDGTLVFPALPQGRWRWELRDPMALGLRGTLNHDGSGTITRRLEGYSSVRGRVEVPEVRTSRATSRPATAFRNRSRTRLGPIHWRTVGNDLQARAFPSDDLGNFRLPLVPIGKTIQITASLNLDATPNFDSPEVQSISVGTDEYVGVFLESPRKPTTGRPHSR